MITQGLIVTAAFKNFLAVQYVLLGHNILVSSRPILMGVKLSSKTVGPDS